MKRLIIPSHATSAFNINVDIEKAISLMESHSAKDVGFEYVGGRNTIIVTAKNFPTSTEFHTAVHNLGFYLEQRNQSACGGLWRVQYRLVLAGVNNGAGFGRYAARIK